MHNHATEIKLKFGVMKKIIGRNQRDTKVVKIHFKKENYFTLI
jgi:hypothetical protein